MAVEIADWRITLWASQLWVDLFCQWKQPGGSQQRLNSFDLNGLLSLSLNSRRSCRKHQIWRRPSFAGALRRPRCAKEEFTTLSHEEIHTILDHEFHEECVLQATIFSVGSATMRTASLPMGEGLNGLKTFFYSPKHATLTLTHWQCSSAQFDRRTESLGMASSERPIPCLRRSFAAGGQMAAARRAIFSQIWLFWVFDLHFYDDSVLSNDPKGLLISKPEAVLYFVRN